MTFSPFSCVLSFRIISLEPNNLPLDYHLSFPISLNLPLKKKWQMRNFTVTRLSQNYEIIEYSVNPKTSLTRVNFLSSSDVTFIRNWLIILLPWRRSEGKHYDCSFTGLSMYLIHKSLLSRRLLTSSLTNKT